MTTEEWLRGAVGFTLTDENIQHIFVNREITWGEDASTMSEKQRDLSRADAYMIYVTSSNKGAYKIQDGNSSESIGGESFTYRENAERMAIYLYNKWDEIPFDLNDSISSGTSYW